MAAISVILARSCAGSWKMVTACRSTMQKMHSYSCWMRTQFLSAPRKVPMWRFPDGCMPEKTRVFMVSGTGVNSIVSNFEVTVEKLVYGGDGLARLDEIG